MRGFPLYLLCILILSACAAGTQPMCPVKKTWTLEEQREIAAEHNALPPDSILRGVLEDWERMRKATP